MRTQFLGILITEVRVIQIVRRKREIERILFIYEFNLESESIFHYSPVFPYNTHF